MERVRLWWKPVLACVVAVLGALSLAGQIKMVVQGRAELADLRTHGTRVPGEARVMTHCGGSGRSYSCGTSAVRLDFTDTRKVPWLVGEKSVASSLYVPRGKLNDEAAIATTVVYDPADPEDAQALGAVGQNVLDLARHNLSTLVITVLMAVLGTGVALGSWPDRAARTAAAGAVAGRRDARAMAWRRELDESDEAVRRARGDRADGDAGDAESGDEGAGGGRGAQSGG
ncbi:hypothetical protein [Streptomyces sp. NBC_01497]|uniref:hypothetical protein n=1 Tax=Streptomyces sp. NBC_01497 TaxID=2903885 RepID=UPI002E309CA4|nr:hypothetical protein [Streptomyces sp. NBC_01497]